MLGLVLVLRKEYHYWFNGKLISVFGALSNVHKPMRNSYISVPDFQVQNCALGAILGFQEGAPSITVGGEVPVRGGGSE